MNIRQKEVLAIWLGVVVKPMVSVFKDETISYREMIAMYDTHKKKELFNSDELTDSLRALGIYLDIDYRQDLMERVDNNESKNSN